MCITDLFCIKKCKYVRILKQGFDQTLLKRRKKTFDLDAALGLDDGSKKEEPKEEEPLDTGAADLDDNLDLESFGKKKKKKKKKKKPFNLDELEGDLPSTNEGEEEANNAAQDEPEDDDINLDMNFSMENKKKKPKKKEFDKLFADKGEEDKSEDKENGRYSN